MSDDMEMDEKGKKLTPEAERALAEAAARRQAAGEGHGEVAGEGAGGGAGEGERAQAEIGGRKGPDPVRFGDWEKDGIISDF